ncbi:MAG: 16S ribosomal RNA methyltransferase A [Euryarchaeota archaeon]|nr:16S ribosomal RNA methyltransferase A [Euryarchaeota archaeon]MBU4490905.1 16S ribosomal RNA methyltransferase A [Euryarchaeota archaeon]MCG2727838.1 16S ribosomal RNA methyltransferase A [Candidatus Methanoperedenaceae archaeon]
MKWYKKDQHFLVDERILDRITGYGRLNKQDTVLEIGAGYGNLTEKLAGCACKVIAIEADAQLASSLTMWKNVEVIIGDALKTEFPSFNKVISNLPYSISSPVTFKLLRYKFDLGILMYQYEFAKRMAALHSSKDYSRLSIAVQYYADVEILEVVPRSAFRTPPQVNSAIVKLVPRPAPYKVKDEGFFMKFITAAFSQRRKKLRNAILNNADFLGIKDIVSALKKLPAEMTDRRAETLSPEELAKLADILADEKT